MDTKIVAKITAKRKNRHMELLPQVQVKSDQKDSREKEVFRKLELSRQVEKEQKAIDAVIQDFDPEKVKIKKEFEEFRKTIEARRSELLGEILTLEKKRDTVMEPFYKIKLEAQEMITVAQSYERRIKEEAKKVNALRDELDRRERWIKEREGELLKKE